MIGQTISHYKIMEKLGEGGMGIVYKAHDTMLDRTVALKFLPGYLTSDPTEKERFHHEAKAAAALTHQNIAVVYEIGEHDGQVFISMECVEGKTLRQMISGNTLSIKQVLDIAIQIADGLNAAHKKGIVHRDIKPENIMLATDGGVVKIMDFGLAKLKGATKLTKAGSTLGTAAYMSPEQARGEDVDQRTDIFSFGVVLYEMLAGRTPFRGEHTAALMYSIANEESVPLARFNEQVTDGLQHIVSKALAKETDERYQHVDDLLADLRSERKKLEYARSGYIRAGEVPGQTMPPVKAKPRRRFIGIGAGVAVVLVLIVLVLVFRPFRTQDQTTHSKAKERSIAVLYFENRSGEKDIDKILVDLLTTNLSRDRELEVVSSQRLFDILKQLDKQDAETIDKSTATEVARRAEVNTMLMGSIIRMGNAVRITAQLLDVQNGNIIGSEEVNGQKVEDIFSMVDALTSKIRDEFRLSHTSEGGEQLKIADVTTQSFEAYKYYQQGLDRVWHWDFGEAGKDFQKAIEVDSTFAMAYYQLAYAQMIDKIGDPTADIFEAQMNANSALRYSARTTPKEQLFIRQFHAVALRNFNLSDSLGRILAECYPNDKEALLSASPFGQQEGIPLLEKALELDPTYANVWNQLAYTYSFVGDHTKAISTIKKYIALQPDVSNVYDSAVDVYLQAGEYDAAYKLCEEALRQHPDWKGMHLYYGYIYLMRDEEDRAREEFNECARADNDTRVRAMYGNGFMNLHGGRYQEAYLQFKNLVEDARKRTEKNRLMHRLLALGRIQAEMGKVPEAVLSFDEAKQLSGDVYSQSFNPVPVIAEYLSGLAALQSNDVAQAENRAKTILQLCSGFPDDAVLKDQYFLLNSEISLRRKDGKALASALSNLSSLSRVDAPRSFILRAQADALKGDREKAIQALKDFENRYAASKPVMGGNAFDYFLERSKVNYRIAKLYEQMGDMQKAVEYYTKALYRWRNADSDLPDVIDAKARLARLRGVVKK